jgi:error-prone DNA polymerase
VADRYIELHARSAFSFLEGSSMPEELVEFCERFEMPAMALVDRNGVYGAPRFHMAAKKAGIKAHVGAEITCTDGRTYPFAGANQARVSESVSADHAHEITREEG